MALKTRLTGRPLNGVVPLPEAALLLNQSWKATLDLVLKGRLDGERRIVGPKGGCRWFVSVKSVERVARQRRRRMRKA